MTDGYMLAFGPCFACKLLFAFDPDTVPSIPIDPDTGLPPDLGGDPERAVRLPVCPDCLAYRVYSADGFVEASGTDPTALVQTKVQRWIERMKEFNRDVQSP